jgi:hypothetical protein
MIELRQHSEYICSFTERRHVQFPARRLCAALITIAGLSIFVDRVDAVPSAKDLAQKATEIHWPTGYSPERADVFSHEEVVVPASPSTVWRYLVAAEQMADVYPDSENSPLEFSIPAETITTTRRDVGILIAGASKLQTPNHFLSNSGVVASAIAYGNSFEAARSQASALAETFNGFHYRDDIGLRLDVPEVYRS